MGLRFAVAAVLCLIAVPAAAEDKEPCPADLVCASAPETVMAAMTVAELVPTLSKDSDGDPMIESEKAAYRFEVYFYGCKEHAKCDSLRFEARFEKAPENTAELANKWNASKRFLQAYVRQDGEFAVSYDVATIGGLNETNFRDVLDWWQVQLDGLAEFFEAEVPKAAG